MKKIFALALMAFVAGVAFAQSAEKISEILNAEKLTYSQAAYLSQTAKIAIFIKRLDYSQTASQSAKDDEITEGAAFAGLKNSGLIKQDVSSSDQVNAKTFALICTKIWDIKGSMFLKVDKTGRYAFRQMKADGVFSKNTDPGKKLSGREALYIISKCLEIYESEEGAK